MATEYKHRLAGLFFGENGHTDLAARCEPSSRAVPMRVLWIPILVASILTVGCRGDTPTGLSPDPTVTGSWYGSLNDQSVTMTLSEAADGSVTGEGIATTDSSRGIALTVIGSHAFPRIALGLFGYSSEAVVYRGRVKENAITGTLNGSGFTDEAFVLERR